MPNRFPSSSRARRFWVKNFTFVPEYRHLPRDSGRCGVCAYATPSRRQSSCLKMFLFTELVRKTRDTGAEDRCHGCLAACFASVTGLILWQEEENLTSPKAGNVREISPLSFPSNPRLEFDAQRTTNGHRTHHLPSTNLTILTSVFTTSPSHTPPPHSPPPHNASPNNTSKPPPSSSLPLHPRQPSHRPPLSA